LALGRPRRVDVAAVVLMVHLNRGGALCKIWLPHG